MALSQTSLSLTNTTATVSAGAYTAGADLTISSNSNIVLGMVVYVSTGSGVLPTGTTVTKVTSATSIQLSSGTTTNFAASDTLTFFTRVLVSPTVDGKWLAANITVQNQSTTVSVLLGDSTVAPNAYGFQLASVSSGQRPSITLGITSNDAVYATCASGTSVPISVLTQRSTFTPQSYTG